SFTRDWSSDVCSSDLGLHQVRLVQLAQQGDIERVSRGVYRFTRFPVSRHGHLMEAVLWPQVRRPDIVGVISHESALAMHELSDEIGRASCRERGEEGH